MGRINPKKLGIRVMTALVVGPVSLLILYLGGLYFYIFTAFALVLSLIEAIKISMRLSPCWAYALFLTLYLVAAFACFCVIYTFSPLFPLLLVLLVSVSDTGAYFFGKIIGGPKMATAISPNKTWAGLIGACLCPGLFYVLWTYFTPSHADEFDFYLMNFATGICLGFSAQAGDLLMSMIKRKAEVKDMGNILPGHGGVLDRIDGLILCSVTFAVAHYLFAEIL